ncbi:uncharacterized protein EV422DRAFT_611449 [Fimicolochytrium jonesii]|uniref:uncharacterized protein n=1 Tax=Fimicolochytrium jonesii TaxID=1396493 RepID=UPI0022FDF9FE|nr:uncharacterized protein EV422DRAFT_611449 [Fimicolochytrium jonesii]KAI8823387.1 hypothetical protein EV422DRAFT_611449 [Fimicolochytrium jonesii]
MSLRSKPSTSSLQSSNELSLESFYLEPGAPEGNKAGGFLTSLWRAAVGRATNEAAARTLQNASTTGHNAVGTPQRRKVEEWQAGTSVVRYESPGRDELLEKGSFVDSVDNADSELSASETASQASTPNIDTTMSEVLSDDVEKNKSSLKLIRRMRNIGSTGITKDFWMRDDKVKECYECKQVFTTFRRKHHCRICGQIFCHKCASSIVPGERFGYPGEMRVCNFCLKIMIDYKNNDSMGSKEHSPLSQSAVSRKASWKPIQTSPTATEPRIAIASPGSHNPPSSTKPWPGSPSPDGSLEGFRKMLGSSLFQNKRVTITEDAMLETPGSSSDPFRGKLPQKERTSEDPSSENLIDPEAIVEYVTDDESEVGLADLWATSPFLNFPSNTGISTVSVVATPLKNIRSLNGVADSPIIDSDTWDYGEANQRKRRTHRRVSRNDELRQEFSKDKAKRRNVSSGHPRPSRYSARAISKQLSKSTLVSQAGTLVAPSTEDLSMVSNGSLSRHRRTDSGLPTVELNASSLEHLRRLLGQVLSESDISPIEGWESVLMKIMLRVCDSIQPDVRGGDFIDIRHYVKIKKIPGGLPADSEYVCGVVCSKNVAHKKMIRPIANPKIMLLTFALEYQRVENQFLSLEPLLAQEREHLKNLVSRVVALRPDVVLVEKTVSRIALEYFLEANVAIAYNVKGSVIEALARCTKGDIIASMDKLALEPKLGTCESFNIKTFMNSSIPGYRKTFLYFAGCPKELGCTIVLRGGTQAELAKIKQIADLMAFVVYNLKLETFLFRDQFAMEPPTDSEPVDKFLLEGLPDSAGAVPAVKKTADATPLSKAIRPYEEIILSASPHVKFPLPYLLMRLKEEEQRMLLSNKKQVADKAKQELAKEGDADNEVREYIRTILDQSSGWLSSIETRAGINNLLENSSSLSPFGHQSITVLYSNVCAATSVPCQAPEQHLIEYYRGTDMTLGQYLEELCCNAEYLCPAKLCDRKMLMHFRSYAHGQGRVNVVIEEFASPMQGMEDVILMWSFCKLCNQVTPVVPMSEEAWKYSFGKYLELAYYHAKLGCRADMCPHDIFRDHIRYFALKNLAVRFEYEMIDLLEVVVPPKRLRFVPEIPARLRQQDYELLNEQIVNYYDSLSERIKTFTFDLVPQAKAQSAKDAISDMGKKASSEKKYILQLLQQTLITSAATDTLAFNGTLRVLQEKVVQWDLDFAAFVRRFLQTDTKEIRRSTAAQLKRMFVDGTGVQRSGLAGLPEDTGALAIEMGLNPSSLVLSFPELGKSPSQSTTPSFGRMMQTRFPDTSPGSPQSRINRRMSMKLMKDLRVKRAPLEIVPSLRPLSSTPDYFPGTNYFENADGSANRTKPGSQAVLESPFDDDVPDITIESIGGPSMCRYASDEDEDDLAIGNNVDQWSENDSDMPPLNNVLAESIEDVLTADIQTISLTPAKQRPASISSHNTSTNQNIKDDEEDMPLEWNIISGVAGETSEHLQSSTDQLDLNKELSPSAATSGERTSIMKTLTSLWTGNAANLAPLQCPLAPTEHIFPDSNVVVREEEPSSIIAFTLDSKHYKEKLQGLGRGGESDGSAGVNGNAGVEDMTANPRVSVEFDDAQGAAVGMEETLLRGTGTHIRYQFWDGPTRMNCKIFFAEQFEALRRNCGVDDKFAQSLARCMRWDALGGKSGSTFLKTKDDRLIIKQLSRLELDALYKFAPAYFEYMSQAIFHELPTVLAKIFGFYRISYKNPTTGRSMRFDCFVMENLFYERTISRIFDLKGSMRNRHVQSTGRQNEVLLDENLVEFIYESPLFIREHSKKLLRASVWNDTLFLSKLNVMDYSLLVGIDAERNELVVGIVDFIRTFTWDKKLESWVKETAFLGGGGKEPTIVSPRQYKNRFREAMERYFLMVRIV